MFLPGEVRALREPDWEKDGRLVPVDDAHVGVDGVAVDALEGRRRDKAGGSGAVAARTQQDEVVLAAVVGQELLD